MHLNYLALHGQVEKPIHFPLQLLVVNLFKKLILNVTGTTPDIQLQIPHVFISALAEVLPLFVAFLEQFYENLPVTYFRFIRFF